MAEFHNMPGGPNLDGSPDERLQAPHRRRGLHWRAHQGHRRRRRRRQRREPHGARRLRRRRVHRREHGRAGAEEQRRAGEAADRLEADEGARRWSRPERRPLGRARGHGQDPPGARRRGHDLRDDRPWRRHRHGRGAGDREPGQRTRRADGGGRHQAVQVRGQEAPDSRPSAVSRRCATVSTRSSRSPTSAC